MRHEDLTRHARELSDEELAAVWAGKAATPADPWRPGRAVTAAVGRSNIRATARQTRSVRPAPPPIGPHARS